MINRPELPDYNKKIFVKYPITKKCFAKGSVGNIPYSPIYNVPDYISNWTFNKINDAYDLFWKVDEMCNLFHSHRYMIYQNCLTLQSPHIGQLIEVKKAKQTKEKPINIEQVRCEILSEQIYFNHNNKVKDKTRSNIIAYTFKYYINPDQWNYFSMCPVPVILYENICKEIHKNFSFYYSIIIFAYDNNRYPYIEVLLSNMPRLFKKAYLSKDNSSMSYTISKLNSCLNEGIIKGANEALELAKSKYNPINCVEDYRKLINPSISDLNFNLL